MNANTAIIANPEKKGPEHADAQSYLTAHFDTLIAVSIKSGQFSNASEAVHEGLRLLEQR